MHKVIEHCQLNIPQTFLYAKKSGTAYKNYCPAESIEFMVFRIRIAKWSAILFLLCTPLSILYLVASVIGCLAGCSSSFTWEDAIGYTCIGIAVLSAVTGVTNFLYQIYQYRWAGLIGWEKMVIYIALTVAASPLIVFIFLKVQFLLE